MTIRLLTAYDKFPINAIIALDAATEAGLIGAKMASADTAGGVPYIAPTAPNQRTPAQVEMDASGAIVGLAHPDGRRILVISSAPPNNNDGRPDGTIYIQTA